MPLWKLYNMQKNTESRKITINLSTQREFTFCHIFSSSLFPVSFVLYVHYSANAYLHADLQTLNNI